MFAVMGGSIESVPAELAVMSAFLVAAIAGLEKTPWVFVAARSGHGVRWPDFRAGYDVVAAFDLAALLVRPIFSAAWERRRTAGFSAGRERASGS